MVGLIIPERARLDGTECALEPHSRFPPPLRLGVGEIVPIAPGVLAGLAGLHDRCRNRVVRLPNRAGPPERPNRYLPHLVGGAGRIDNPGVTAHARAEAVGVIVEGRQFLVVADLERPLDRAENVGPLAAPVYHPLDPHAAPMSKRVVVNALVRDVERPTPRACEFNP